MSRREKELDDAFLRELLEWLRATHGYRVVEDRNGLPVVLTDSNWNLSYALENAPGLELYDVEPL